MEVILISSESNYYLWFNTSQTSETVLGCRNVVKPLFLVSDVDGGSALCSQRIFELSLINKQRKSICYDI